MNADTLRNFLNTRPFEPFEVMLSSGQALPVRHPENVLVLKNTVVITEPETDMVQWCSLIHILGIRRRSESAMT